MTAMPTGGLVAISVTPMDAEGEINAAGVARLTDFYVDCGSTGIAILGVMGEANRMTDLEARRVVDLTVEAVAGRVPIVVGVSNPAVARIQDLSEHAMSRGCAGVLLQPTPGLAGDANIAAYFQAIATVLGSHTPICVQDFPKSKWRAHFAECVEDDHRLVRDGRHAQSRRRAWSQEAVGDPGSRGRWHAPRDHPHREQRH